MDIKSETRVIGFNDGPFKSFSQKYALLVGVLTRGPEHIDGILSTKIEIDGLDATDKIVKLIKKTKHYGQLRVILLNGITFAGFNVVDIKKLHAETKKPVIAIIRKKPDLKKFRDALRKTQYCKEKLKMVEKAGKIQKIIVKDSEIYVQSTGISLKGIEKLLNLTVKHSLIPEPIRMAHIIASGIVNGESRGRV